MSVFIDSIKTKPRFDAAGMWVTVLDNTFYASASGREGDQRSSAEDVKVILPFEFDREYYVEELGEIPRKPIYSFFKRVFDLFFSFVLLILLLLPIAVIAIAVRISSKGSAFYVQERLGLGGRKFNIIKFRTMRSDAEEDGARWCEGDDDDRITRLGRILRKTRMDELPQLWCILRGTMSFVGPRPERECFYRVFERYVHGFSERLKVKPGLTGLAQVNGGYDLMPQEKILYDVEYIKKRSHLLDLKIMFKTVAVVFTHKGAK